MEDDGEIEYLDEDENIVQQYVQTVQSLPVPVPVVENIPNSDDVEDQIAPLLVERKSLEHKRKHKTDDDSDYVPGEDDWPKRKRGPAKKPQSLLNNRLLKPFIKQYHGPLYSNKSYEEKLKNLPNLVVKKQVAGRSTDNRLVIKDNRTIKLRKPDPIITVMQRRKMDIKIPDYDDPICLPVRARLTDEHDKRRLYNWNSICLEQLRKCDGTLGGNKGNVVSSSRTIVLRNVKNKHTGKVDTTIWAKSNSVTENGQKRSDSFSSILPKYREKKMLGSYQLVSGPLSGTKHVSEVVLTKEEQKDGDTLVVYKPKEAVSSVYRMLGGQNSEDMEEDNDTKEKRLLKEVTCAKVCAPCYQASWRGIRKKSDQGHLKCRVCSRNFVSVYNLLTHLKTNHTPQDVRRQRSHISRTLASIVGYHYKCRICQEQFVSIKSLRKHVTKHQGAEVFKCEVGNHMAR